MSGHRDLKRAGIPFLGSLRIVFALLVSALWGCAVPPVQAPTNGVLRDEGPIVVLGDTQRTLFWEAFLLGRERNDAASAELIARIAQEEQPAFLVHLGDMVSSGDSSSEWSYFDTLIQPLRERGIAIYPAFGNHDLWGNRRVALRNARSRFPELSHGAYALRYHGLGLIWLDSNLEGLAGRRQAAWFENALRRFDGPGTRGVLVFMHHPVYTNGRNRHGNQYVISELLPRFFAAKKTLVLMSAHVHGYERFYAEGRQFVVTGGAGGPRVEYDVGKDARWVPAFDTPSGARRPFNYVAIYDRGAALEFVVKCLAHGAECANGELERFSVELFDGRESELR